MGRIIASNDLALARSASTPPAVASLRARAGGYVVDMVIFAAIAMVMLVIAGVVILASSDWAQTDPPDSATYGALAVIGLGTPVVWTAMNLVLLITRRQTGGQYVAGVRLAREDGAPLSLANILVWWFALNPLLFSWPGTVVLLPLAATIALILSRATVAVFVILAVLFIVSPGDRRRVCGARREESAHCTTASSARSSCRPAERWLVRGTSSCQTRTERSSGREARVALLLFVTLAALFANGRAVPGHIGGRGHTGAAAIAGGAHGRSTR